MIKTVEQGAITSLYCSLSDDAKPGHFHSDCQVRKPKQHHTFSKITEVNP
jgi:hypothetical protein